MRKKGISLLLCCVLLFLTACGGSTEPSSPQVSGQTVSDSLRYTQSPGRLQKREAVYVSLEPDGAVRQIEVTDRLITDMPEVRVEDVSSLRDIHALSTDAFLQSDGLNLTWHMASAQMYYSGTTDKTLPVQLTIRYYLNDKETTLRELRGKSGRIRIDVQSENRTGTGEQIIPFLLAGGTILPQDVQQVQVTNGGSIGDGKRDIVFGVMLPGLGDALDVDALRARIPSDFSVQFTAKRYVPDSFYFAAVPLRTDRLGDVIGEAIGGAGFTVPDISDMITQMQSVMSEDTLQNVFLDLPDSTALFRAAGDAMQAYSRQAPLLDVLQTYLTAENAQLLRQSIEALSGTSLSQYAALIQDPVFISFVADLGTVSDAFLRLIPTLSAFIADLQKPEVLQALETLPDTLEKLAVLTDSLESNRAGLQMLTDLSENGTFGKLAELTHSLRSMLDSGTLEMIQDMAGQADTLRSRVQTLLESGKKYDIFTLSPENAECSVYFVFKTQVD